MPAPTPYFPDLGFGLGLRIPHYAHIFEHWPEVDWFEIISENFMDTGGKAKRNLARMREHYPIVMHGIALSIGTIDPLNSDYLRKLKELIKFVNPAWVSDHLCWTGIAHKNSHDLLPVPYTEEALKHIVCRIKQVQDYLERPIALENPSTYLEFKASHIPEAEFIAAMAQESGCHLLLDVNNVYVTCYNHRLDAKAYLDALPLDKVAQIHLSGHSNYGTHIIDTHDDHVVDEVWALYQYTLHKAGRMINTMVEWDDKLPEWDVLYAELGKAKESALNAASYAALPNLAQDHLHYIPNKITPLSDAQHLMQKAILLGKHFDSQPDSWIRAKAQFPANDQLGVYINAYRYRLYDVTAEDYPVLAYYLGKEAFDALIKDFVNNTPSRYLNIGRYAADLPGFLMQDASADLLACELAILENAISQLQDPEETIALSPQDLEGMSAEALMEEILYPRKAMQLFSFAYPVNDYYIAVREEKNPLPPEMKKSFVAVFRHEDSVWRMALEEQEFQLLQKLFSGLPIGKALEQLQAELDLPEEELSLHLSHWFSRWIRNGLLARYSKAENDMRETA